MELPRRLMKLEDGRFCEEDDPNQAMNFRPKGFIISDAEAERIGLKAYLDETGWGDTAEKPGDRDAPAAKPEEPSDKPEEKAVAQAEVEDKAVDGPDESKEDQKSEEPPLTPGLHIQPESRRVGGGRRG